MSHPAHRNLELEAAIERDPDNIETYLVYADWLQARGDQRGELIALKCASAQAPPEDSWRFDVPAYALLEKHQEALMGRLAGLRQELRWRWGFIHEVRLTGRETTRAGRPLTPAKFLRQLLTLPSARFLRGLDVEMANEKSPSFQQLLNELNTTVLPTVDRLTLGDLAMFRASFARRPWSLGDFWLSSGSLPRLRSLTLCGQIGQTEQMDLPELRELTIFSGMRPGSFAHCLATARLPKLERLVIEGHEDLMDSMREAGELQYLLELQGLSQLKHLGLRRVIDSTSACGGVMCRLLARSDLLRRLETLDLSQDLMTDEVAKVLIDHAAAFKHLRRLDFSGDLLSPEIAARVAALCGGGEVS